MRTMRASAGYSTELLGAARELSEPARAPGWETRLVGPIARPGVTG